MAGATSLLRSAASRRAKIQTFEDQEAAFEYSQSAKTYEDFQSYSKYLNNRIVNTSDPSQTLSYTRNLSTAQSGYISNEIQRQSINIIEGRGTSTDKYTKMTDLFYQAANSGNFDLAQSLHLQLDNLSVKIQDEQAAAQRAAGTLAMNGVKTLDALVKQITKGTDGIELSDGTQIKSLPMLAEELKANGDTKNGYFGEVFRTIEALRQTVVDAYTGATTQEAVDAIESKYGDVINGTKGFIKVAGATDMLNMQDIELAYRSALANNPIYSPTEVRDENTGQLTYQLKANKIDDFTWIRQDDGTYNAVDTRARVLSPNQTLGAKITNEGSFLGDTGKQGISTAYNPKTGNIEQIKTTGVLTIGERLKNLGISPVENGDGTISLTLPDGEQVQGAINPDGSINYFGQPGQYSGGQAGLYKIDLFTGQMREVAPDESSIFGQNGQFGQISKPSDAGVNIIKSLAGVTQNNGKLFSPLAQITSTANDFTGTGVPVVGGNLQGSTNILEHAQQRQETLQALATAQQQLQPAQTFNLNQTPVQQTAQNGQPVRQLSVAAPAPAPRVSVAAPPPTPQITSVGGATNVPHVTGVTNNSFTGRVRVG